MSSIYPAVIGLEKWRDTETSRVIEALTKLVFAKQLGGVDFILGEKVGVIVANESDAKQREFHQKLVRLRAKDPSLKLYILCEGFALPVDLQILCVNKLNFQLFPLFESSPGSLLVQIIKARTGTSSRFLPQINYSLHKTLSTIPDLSTAELNSLKTKVHSLQDLSDIKATSGVHMRNVARFLDDTDPHDSD